MKVDHTYFSRVLQQPSLAPVKKWLETRIARWREPALVDELGVRVVRAPKKPIERWSVNGEVGITIVEGDVDVLNLKISANLSMGLILFVGNVNVRNLLNGADASVVCGGTLDVEDFAFVASPDAELYTFGAAEVGVLYSGHSAGWLTAMGPISVDVLDDYVAGAKVRGKRPLKAASLVLEAMVDPEDKEELDREAVLEAFDESVQLLRVPSGPTAKSVKKLPPGKKGVKKTAVKKAAPTKSNAKVSAKKSAAKKVAAKKTVAKKRR